MLISVLCPTRGRPQNILRLISSATETATLKNQIEFVFYLDDDDVIGQQGLTHVINQYQTTQILACIGSRIVLTEMWNVCCRKASGEIFMLCGDDIEFKTQGWDEIVRNEFLNVEDKIIFAHGNDGAYGDRFGTHGFLHRNWVETVGYFVPPYFSSDYPDTWLNDVSNMIERRRYIQIYTLHHHPVFGLAEWDQTHQERLIRHANDKVEEIYKSKALEREIDALKLKNFILTFELNKFKKLGKNK